MDKTRSHRHSKPHRSSAYWLPAVTVLAIAAFLRFYGLTNHPAKDWDESNYLEISRNVAEHGAVMAKTPFGQTPEVYFYNPVFYFWVLGGWFKLFGTGILQARSLAAGASVLTLLMLAVFLRRLLGRWALLAVLLLAFDGWMVFTNRVGWIENLGFVFAIGSLWLYERALATPDHQERSRPAVLRFVTAGLTLAFAFVFKHQFGYFIVAVLLTWLIVRRLHRGHLALLGTTTLGICIYAASMLLWSSDYKRETTHQLLRLIGKRSSPGAVSGMGQIVTAFQNQYSIYFGMLIALVLASWLVLYRMAQIILRFAKFPRQPKRPKPRTIQRTRRERWDYAFEQVSNNALLFAWAASVLLCFGATLKVRLPHYTFLVIVPVYCYLAAELRDYVKRGERQYWRHCAVTALVIVVVGSGLFATHQRMVLDDRDAFGQTTAWIEHNVPPGSLVITEEPIGNNTPDTVQYCKMDHVVACQEAGADHQTYLVVYTTLTFRPPDSLVLERMIKEGELLAKFEDFKATITVYRLRQQLEP